MNTISKLTGRNSDNSVYSVKHPTKVLLGREQAAAVAASGDYLVQRKYDGEFCAELVLETAMGRARFISEHVTCKSGALLTAEDRRRIQESEVRSQNDGLPAAVRGFHAIITVAEVDGQGVLNLSWAERWQLTKRILESGVRSQNCPVVLAEEILAPDFSLLTSRGAEGFCLHAWEGPWGGMFAWKAAQVHLVRVAALHADQSVAIVDAATGQARGNLKLGGGKREMVAVGSLLRVEALGVHAGGKLRQAVPCRNFLATDTHR